MHFMQTLEQAKQSMGQLLQQHVDLEESSKAINSVFPDHQFFGHEQQILEEVQNRGFTREMENLVDQFTQHASGEKYNRRT